MINSLISDISLRGMRKEIVGKGREVGDRKLGEGKESRGGWGRRWVGDGSGGGGGDRGYELGRGRVGYLEELRTSQP